LLQKDYGFGVVLFAFSVVAITDIMAFVFGKMLGGLRLCPVISPNKTLAGFIGGGFGAVLAAYNSLVGAGWIFLIFLKSHTLMLM
jgi:phosphatidate cytidylyltransferase